MRQIAPGKEDTRHEGPKEIHFNLDTNKLSPCSTPLTCKVQFNNIPCLFPKSSQVAWGLPKLREPVDLNPD